MRIYVCGGCEKRFVEGVNLDDVKDGKHITAKIDTKADPEGRPLLSNLKREECGPVRSMSELMGIGG